MCLKTNLVYIPGFHDLLGFKVNQSNYEQEKNDRTP